MIGARPATHAGDKHLTTEAASTPSAGSIASSSSTDISRALSFRFITLDTQIYLSTLLDVWRLPAKVVAEADGRRVGYIKSHRIHGVAEPCFE